MCETLGLACGNGKEGLRGWVFWVGGKARKKEGISVKGMNGGR